MYTCLLCIIIRLSICNVNASVYIHCVPALVMYLLYMQLLKLLVNMGSMQSTEAENKEGGVVKSSLQTEGRRVSVATKHPLGEDHMSADSDVDEDDDEEESDSGDLGEGGGEGGDGDSPSEDTRSEKTAQPLTEYFVNVVSE